MNSIEIKINRNSEENKIINSIDVFRDDKWAYTITESEFRDILFELSKNRLGVPTMSRLKDIVAINVIAPESRWAISNTADSVIERLKESEGEDE